VIFSITVGKNRAMSQTESTKFTTEECLKFERIKNEKLQYFLVNSVKMTNELEIQLMNARRELKVARDELNAHKTEVVLSSKYRQEKIEKEIETSEDSEEEDIDQSSTNKKRKQTQQERRKGSKSTASKTVKSYDAIRPINSRVEIAIESVKTALSNPHINTPARDFLFKFVCRIFDGGDVFYGYLVSYNRLHFQVSY
jgi:hypothetical protein